MRRAVFPSAEDLARDKDQRNKQREVQPFAEVGHGLEGICRSSCVNPTQSATPWRQVADQPSRTTAVAAASWFRAPACWPVLLGFCLFVALGSLVIPYPGLQEDEAIFAAPIYQASTSLYHLRVGSADVPMMVLNYLGAAKSWIYARIFRRWKPSRYSVRVPLLILYGTTLWMVFYLLRVTIEVREVEVPA